jgi:hypothetical protein
MPDKTELVADRIVLALCELLKDINIEVSIGFTEEWKEIIIKELAPLTTPDISKTPTQPDYGTVTFSPCPIKSSVVNAYTIRHMPLGTQTTVLASCFNCAAKQYSEACKIPGLFEVINNITGELRYIQVDKDWFTKEVNSSPPYLFDR